MMNDRSIRICAVLFGFLFFSAQAMAAEEFACTMQWEHREDSTPFVIEIDGDKVVTRGAVTVSNFKVAANENNDLLLYAPITRPWAGTPLGFSALSLDKKSGTFIYSFVTDSEKLFASGSCSPVTRD